MLISDCHMAYSQTKFSTTVKLKPCLYFRIKWLISPRISLNTFLQRNTANISFGMFVFKDFFTAQ